MLKSRYFMKIDWEIFREKRCLYCSQPFTPPIGRKDSLLSAKNYIHYHLCPQCAAQVQKQRTGFCLNCGEILADANNTVAHCGHCHNQEELWQSFLFFAKYENVFREIILKAKFNHNRACMKFLGELSAMDFLEQKNYPKHLHIIPMPLHEKRLVERGANQCIEIISYFIAYLQKHSHYTATLHKNLLRKSRHTIAQSTLDKKDRQQNIRNSFAISEDYLPAKVQGKNAPKEKTQAENFQTENPLKEILLFDDIATTNSTLKESCRVLKKAGIEKIHVMVLAKA